MIPTAAVPSALSLQTQRRFMLVMDELLSQAGFSSSRKLSFLVALSGGADSVALLLLLQSYAAERGHGLSALHVHHGIRGAEADRDAAFCRRLCEARSIPFACRCTDVPALARQQQRGLEDMAREERYRLLEEARLQTGMDFVLTAHHAGDQLETLLFRMTRGTGLGGMRGILPRRGHLLRPLLSFTAEELQAYCRAEQSDFVIDSTNADPCYARNFLRGQVVPLLRRLNPDADAAAARLAATVARDEAYLQEEAAKVPHDPALSQLLALPDAIAVRVLAREFHAISDTQLTYLHIEGLLRLLRQGKTEDRLALPGAWAIRERDRLRFCKTVTAPPAFLLPLSAGEWTHLPAGGAVFFGNCEKLPQSVQNVYNFATRAELNSATIDASVTVRSRQAGDTLRYSGQAHAFKKLMQDRGISAKERQSLPLFCVNGEVAWIPHCPVADGYSPASGERKVLFLYLTPAQAAMLP